MSPRRAKAVGGRVGDDPATVLREHLIDATDGLLSRSPIAAITTREAAVPNHSCDAIVPHATNSRCLTAKVRGLVDYMAAASARRRYLHVSSGASELPISWVATATGSAACM